MAKQPHSTNRKSAPIPARAALVNEGEPVPITILEPINNDAGNVTARMQLPLSVAQAPRRRFTADAFAILSRDDSYHLIFLQRRVDGSQIRAMVDVQMTTQAVNAFADGIKLEKLTGPYSSPFDLAKLQEPEQTVTLSANYARSASSPNGSCIDFYFASQFSLMEAIHTKQIHLEGEVRIVTSSCVFEGLMRTLSDLKKFHSGSNELPTTYERKVDE